MAFILDFHATFDSYNKTKKYLPQKGHLGHCLQPNFVLEIDILLLTQPIKVVLIPCFYC